MIKRWLEHDPSIKEMCITFCVLVVMICVCIWSWTYAGPKPVYGFCIGKNYDSGHSWDSNTYIGSKLVSTRHYAAHDPEYRLEMLLVSGETEFWTVPEDIYDEANVGSIVKRY